MPNVLDISIPTPVTCMCKLSIVLKIYIYIIIYIYMQLVIANKMMFYSGIHSCMTILVVNSTTAMARSVMQVCVTVDQT